jgi:glycosyltransferase involved in cell wall biosynthesis
MRPLVSVALPAAKARFLNAALESVVAQTYRDFELIIFNNGADADVRAEIARTVDRYRDERIAYYAGEVVPPSRGASKVVQDWNRCLRQARGEFFVMFSDDDVYEPEFLEELVGLAENHPETNLFHCRLTLIDEEGRSLSLSPTCPEHESALDFIWHRLNNYRVQFAPDFMCRTRVLKDIGGFYDLPLAWGSDDLTWFSIALRGGVAFTPRILLHWRRSKLNISGAGGIEPRLQALDRYAGWIESFLETYSPVNESEKEILAKMREASSQWSRRAKDSLFFAEARGYSRLSRLTQFVRLRKRYGLSPKGLIKSMWRSLSGDERNG